MLTMTDGIGLSDSERLAGLALEIDLLDIGFTVVNTRTFNFDNDILIQELQDSLKRLRQGSKAFGKIHYFVGNFTKP